MRRFLKNSAILFTPLVIWAVFVLWMDPFHYFYSSKEDKVMSKNAFKLNPLLYRSIAFKNNPDAFVLIGDSRTNALPAKKIKELSGSRYKRFNTNAAKLNEIVEMVYFAHEQTPLKHVVIGINFSMFNRYSYGNRFEGVKEILDNPLRYIYNKNTAEVCYYDLKTKLTGNGINIKPPLNREEFWKWNIEVKAKHWYGKYADPLVLKNALRELDEFSQAQNFKLTFIVVPHHREFQDQITSYGLENKERIFKSFLFDLDAEVIDFDYPNAITTNKANFKDPIHYNDSIADIIVEEVFTGNYTFGKTKY